MIDLEQEREAQRLVVAEFQKQKDEEIHALKTQYAQDLQQCYTVLRQKERTIENLQTELELYR